MQTYSTFRPTDFDPAGCFLDDRDDWLVVPCGRNRNSPYYTNSNFDTAVKLLGGEGDDVEVHRFGHWGPGWFEIIIVRPETKSHGIAEDIERGLQDNPYLDDEDVSNREHEEFLSGWKDYGASEFRRQIKKSFTVTEADEQIIDDADDDKLRDFFIDNAPEPYHGEASGVYINIDSMISHMDDRDYADLIAILSGKVATQEDLHQKVLDFH